MLRQFLHVFGTVPNVETFALVKLVAGVTLAALIAGGARISLVALISLISQIARRPRVAF